MFSGTKDQLKEQKKKDRYDLAFNLVDHDFTSNSMECFLESAFCFLIENL